LVLTSIQRASGYIDWFNPCPNPDGRISVTDLNSCQIRRVFEPATHESRGTATFFMNEPISHTIEIRTDPGRVLSYYQYEFSNIVNKHDGCSGLNSCNFIVAPDGAEIEVNFHYKCVNNFFANI